MLGYACMHSPFVDALATPPLNVGCVPLGTESVPQEGLVHGLVYYL